MNQVVGSAFMSEKSGHMHSHAQIETYNSFPIGPDCAVGHQSMPPNYRRPLYDHLVHGAK